MRVYHQILFAFDYCPLCALVLCERSVFKYLHISRAVSHVTPGPRSGGSKGGARDARPTGVQILSFSCSFRLKKLVSTPTLGVGAPPGKILDPPLPRDRYLGFSCSHSSRLSCNMRSHWIVVFDSVNICCVCIWSCLLWCLQIRN